jgi:hypothetical protein
VLPLTLSQRRWQRLLILSPSAAADRPAHFYSEAYLARAFFLQ